MILFPNAKINIGLKITGVRPDGYHEISTVMVPVGWCDILEIVPAPGCAGHELECGCTIITDNQADNLVIKAIRAVEKYMGRVLPPMKIYLKKIIPMGAGLGGGSADASFTIKGVNTLLGLGLSDRQMAEIALTIGADCPFFIYNRPLLATGIGEILKPIDAAMLNGRGILVAKPHSQAVPTAQAYAGAGIHPLAPGESPAGAMALPVDAWGSSQLLSNDFEASIFPQRREIEGVKERMLACGAMFASMTGSGAAVYGLFENAKMAENASAGFSDCDIFVGSLPY